MRGRLVGKSLSLGLCRRVVRVSANLAAADRETVGQEFATSSSTTNSSTNWQNAFGVEKRKPFSRKGLPR